MSEGARPDQVRREVPAGEVRAKNEATQEEAEHFTGGPGVVATKSQARGASGGIIAGALLGALVGFLIGALLFEGARSIIIAAVAVAVAGGVFGAVAGGIGRSMKKLERTDADV
jgi:predicted lipid-binding transport protein (Tim44 family)